MIESGAEKQLRRSGDSPLKGPYDQHQVPADDSRQRTLTEHLDLYYNDVIACLGDAEPILMFGPGEAKGELKTRLEKHISGRRIICTEATDRMTDGEIVAKVRQHFAASGSDTVQAVSDSGRSRRQH